MADPAVPTNKETQEAKMNIQQEYLGVLFIQHSGLKWYGNLVVKLQNNHTQGSDQYPTTLIKAYDMIVNYCTTKQIDQLDCHDHGIAYYTKDDATGHSRGHGGG